MKDICIYHGPAKCTNPYNCTFHKDDRTCKLNGKIKTYLIYVPKHIRKPDTVFFKNKYTLDGVSYS